LKHRNEYIMTAIAERLIEHGRKLFHAPIKPVQFTNDPAADVLINDLHAHPHAFVLACIMDRQVKAEIAWRISYRFSQKLGGFSIEILSQLSLADVTRLMSDPEPLHRFVEIMSGCFHSGVRRIKRVHAGDASRIWSAKPSSAEVVYRFLEFDGVGPKIAAMAANILAREFKIPLSDYSSIDISADVHIRRVFARLQLCPPDASVEQIIYKAKALHPEFPGLMDLPIWELGRNWCKPKKPNCQECYMNDLCPSATNRHGS
jgi:endonuclease-3